jgi:multidrug efflux pump subunit AcrA (membrane-fusion protein)
MRVLLLAPLLVPAVALGGCSRTKPAPEPPPPPRVTVIRPASVPVRDYWTYNGYLETTKAVEVRSKIRGFLAHVKFAEGTEIAAGDPLYEIDKLEFQTAVSRAEAEEQKAAADILKAEADEKKADAEIRNWKAQLVEAKTELDRVKRAVIGGTESENVLVKAQAVHDVRAAEVSSAEASRDAAKAAANAAKSARAAAAAALRTANIQLGYTDIKAKIGGRIGRTLIDEGNLVLADSTVLTTILKVDELFVYFDAPETDLLAYQQALLAGAAKGKAGDAIPVEVGIGKENGYPHVGKIDFRENRVDTGTGTIRIRGRIDNPAGASGERLMFPGMYARVRVPKSAPTPQLVVPEDTLLTGQEGRFLYVLTPDNKIDKRLVTVGASAWKTPAPVPGVVPSSWAAVNPNPPPKAEGQPPVPARRTIKSMVVIGSGLRADDRVILDGLHRAKPGDAVEPAEWNLEAPK